MFSLYNYLNFYLQVKGCKVRESRKYSVHTRFSALCSSNPNTKYLCADCGTSVMCSEGKAYPIKCEKDLRCSTNITKFEGAICYPEYIDKCSCPKAKTYFQDPYYNGTFFFCNEKDSIPMFYHCQSNMYFNEKAKSCTNEDGLPACSEWGVFPYPDTCNKYYTCTFALEGWIQTRLQCPHNELLNVETGNCENPCNRTSNEFKCEEEGRFENPKHCNQFYECIKNATGGLREIKRSCPPNYHWNKSTHLCVKSENSDCKPETEGPFKNCQNDYDTICNNNNVGNPMMNIGNGTTDLIKSELPNIPLIQIKS